MGRRDIGNVKKKEKEEDGRIWEFGQEADVRLVRAFVPLADGGAGAVFSRMASGYTRLEQKRRGWIRACHVVGNGHGQQLFVQQHSFPRRSPFSLDSSTPFHTGVYMILILYWTHAGVNFPLGPLDPRPSSRHYLYLYVYNRSRYLYCLFACVCGDVSINQM